MYIYVCMYARTCTYILFLKTIIVIFTATYIKSSRQVVATALSGSQVQGKTNNGMLSWVYSLNQDIHQFPVNHPVDRRHDQLRHKGLRRAGELNWYTSQAGPVQVAGLHQDGNRLPIWQKLHKMRTRQKQVSFKEWSLHSIKPKQIHI